MNSFIFDKFIFDEDSLELSLYYQNQNPDISFKEVIKFSKDNLVEYDRAKLNGALELLFLVAGTSYFKAFPTANIKFNSINPTEEQMSFMASIYRDGLSQFIYENNLSLDVIPFSDYYLKTYNAQNRQKSSHQPEVKDILALESGGKDSLLTAALLKKNNIKFKPFNMPYGEDHPAILDQFDRSTSYADRKIDSKSLKVATEKGGFNGHVPITYITASIATVDAILHGQNWVLLSIAHEGDEPHAKIGDLDVNHQWSKTWQAEKLFSEYVYNYVAKDIVAGSPIRKYSELKVAELFVQYCWAEYSTSFSSCNNANYQQGASNTKLKWCVNCPKCANSYLLFAPFVEPNDLNSVMGSDMIADEKMEETFKGLLGIDGVMKPFECVGEIDELRLAYHMAQKRWGDEISKLKFGVPEPKFDYNELYDYNKAFDVLL